MVRKPADFVSELDAMNLRAKHNSGLGNCLFNAFSDQLHGDDSLKDEYRAETVKYMRAHPDQFKPFLEVHAGYGWRRNPKRKSKGALQGAVDSTNPTAEDVDAVFERHLARLAEGGQYGDNMEIAAFANAYKVNVSVFSEAAGMFLNTDCEEKSDEEIKTIYVVLHHIAEHYSSIRSKSGPDTGLPNVEPIIQKALGKTDTDATPKDNTIKKAFSRPWLIDQIQNSLPYPATHESIIEALEAYKGNFAKAVSALMPMSSESSSRSSSIERETDDEEDHLDEKPKKKADRRSSRPDPLHIGKSNKNFDTKDNDSHSTTPDATQLSAALSKLTGDDPNETEDEDWPARSPLQNLETTSDNTSTSSLAAGGKGTSGPRVRIKLSQPKKPGQKSKATTTTAAKEQHHGGEYDADAEKLRPSRVIAKPKRRLYRASDLGSAELAKLKAKKQSHRASLSPTSANSKKSNDSPPVLDKGIDVLNL